MGKDTAMSEPTDWKERAEAAEAELAEIARIAWRTAAHTSVSQAVFDIRHSLMEAHKGACDSWMASVHLKNALSNIANISTTQPAGLNGPEAAWYKGLLFDCIGMASFALARHAANGRRDMTMEDITDLRAIVKDHFSAKGEQG
jgi:hypothetical protein